MNKYELYNMQHFVLLHFQNLHEMFVGVLHVFDYIVHIHYVVSSLTTL